MNHQLLKTKRNLKTEYNSIYEQIAKGAIIRSKANWYERCERNNKYFLNLESHKKTKNSVRNGGVLITDPKMFLQEIQNFYSTPRSSHPLLRYAKPVFK